MIGIWHLCGKLNGWNVDDSCRTVSLRPILKMAGDKRRSLPMNRALDGPMVIHFVREGSEARIHMD